jgi:hypothetical protein
MNQQINKPMDESLNHWNSQSINEPMNHVNQ